MILAISEYVTNKLIKNCITFGFFLLGVLLGIALILLIYQIFVKLKAKKTVLKTEYREINPKDDPIIIQAKEKLHSLDTKNSIEKFLIDSTQIGIDSIKEIAKEYTGGKKYVTLTSGLSEKYPNFDLTFDTDFAVEDFLFFIENTTDVIENTVLSVTDKYSILINSFFKFIGLGKTIRDITVKDVILYLNLKAQKKEQKLIKAIEKKEKQEQKARNRLNKKQNIDNKFIEFFKKLQPEKPITKKEKENKKLFKQNKDAKKKNNTENKFLNLFKIKKKESDPEVKVKKENKKDKEIEIIEKVDQPKLSSFYKPLNKVIIEVADILLVGVLAEARKLYGRGYTYKEVRETLKNAEALLSENNSDEGGNE